MITCDPSTSVIAAPARSAWARTTSVPAARSLVADITAAHLDLRRGRARGIATAKRRVSCTDDAPAADEVVGVAASTGDCNADALPADVVPSINHDEDALAAFLDERGITSTRETYTDGVRWVAWDEEDDAANTAVDQFYAEHYPLSPEELAQMNAEEDALAAFLDQQGITYTRQPGPDGVNYVAWDEEDDAASTAVDQFYTSSIDACVVSVP